MSATHEGSRSAEFASVFNPIILGDGLIGRALAKKLECAHVLSRKDHGFDITNLDMVRRLLADTPGDVVINAIGYTNVDRAQVEPEQARLINGEGARIFAGVCMELGKSPIHISSDFVFPGVAGNSGPYSESSPVYAQSPYIGVYGRSKAEGEQAVLQEAGGRVAIVRIAFPTTTEGGYLPKILGGIDRFPMYYNQRITPTVESDLADAITKIAQLQAGGIYHVASRDVVTPFDYATYIASRIGKQGSVSSSILTMPDDTRETSPRPIHGGLSTIATEQALGLRFMSWRQQVDTYLPNFCPSR